MRGETNVRWGIPQLVELPCFILAYVLIDLSAYFVHRGLHHPWFYVRVHKLHHLWRSPSAWVVSALHPVELLALTLPSMMVLTALPLSFPLFVLMLLGIYVFNAIDHSGLHLQHLPLCRLLGWQAHPEFHDNHHQYFHVNYGAMVDWWDKIGGTYYHPKDAGPAVHRGEQDFITVREARRKSEVLNKDE